MEILKVERLCKQYGAGANQVQALQNVSFSLQKGELAAVVGPSGSGKSTLLNCIGGLDTPTSGKVFLDGEDLYALPEQRRTIFRRQNIGFVFQSFQLIAELNVEQNIIFPLLLDYKKPDPRQLEELLEVLGLSDRRHHLPSQLSGGQQQRVAIGRALITRPMLVLADEPTGNLDSASTVEIMELFTQLNKEEGVTVIIVTHEDDVAAFTDRVLWFEDGQLVSDRKVEKQT